MKDKRVILVVDDLPENIDLLEAYLAGQGYEIVTAANGEEALGKISGNQIDLILLDVMMPGIDGFEITRRVRQDDAHRLLPIILVTSLNEREDRIKGIEAGCDDFISKPVDKMELQARVRSLLKVKAYNDLLRNYREELESEVTGRTGELKKALENLQQDIAERKRAEKELRESEERYRSIFENGIMGISQALPDGCLVNANAAYVQMYGYANTEEMMAEAPDVGQRYVNPKDREEVLRILKEKGVMKPREIVVVRRDGTRFTVLVGAREIRDSDGNLQYYQAEHIDITERKRNEEALKESEKKYRLLADNIHDVIFVLDMNLNYTYISPSVKILRGYKPEELLQKTVAGTLTPSSWELAASTLAEFMELEKSGRREEIPVSKTLQLEMRRKDGTTVWTEVKISLIRDENQQPVSIMGVTRDITGRKQAEEELQQTLESLRKSFVTTVQVMVSAIESRDPYTSGHQLRASNLAGAIATDMGLPPDKIEGIQMAGSIHDIGKLSVPAEILSKPAKLTNIEFSLVKEHARSGYEMLKDVKSPWPLAQIVYQHHERMNGSGYPRNLKGDEILMEARIMAVADVVEAMASHRPYRPSLGINVAMEEIEKNRGILYDAAVADTCLKLFREKGYKLLV